MGFKVAACSCYPWECVLSSFLHRCGLWKNLSWVRLFLLLLNGSSLFLSVSILFHPSSSSLYPLHQVKRDHNSFFFFFINIAFILSIYTLHVSFSSAPVLLQPRWRYKKESPISSSLVRFPKPSLSFNPFLTESKILPYVLATYHHCMIISSLPEHNPHFFVHIHAD